MADPFLSGTSRERLAVGNYRIDSPDGYASNCMTHFSECRAALRKALQCGATKFGLTMLRRQPRPYRAVEQVYR